MLIIRIYWKCKYNTLHVLVTLTLLMNTSIDPTPYSNSEFGAGSGPFVWNDVYCYYWNTDIFDCMKDIYPDSSCSTDEIAGVGCTEGNIYVNCVMKTFLTIKIPFISQAHCMTSCK